MLLTPPVAPVVQVQVAHLLVQELIEAAVVAAGQIVVAVPAVKTAARGQMVVPSRVLVLVLVRETGENKTFANENNDYPAVVGTFARCVATVRSEPPDPPDRGRSRRSISAAESR